MRIATIWRSLVCRTGWGLLMGLGCAGLVTAEPLHISEAQPLGPESSLTLQTTLRPASEDVGKAIRIFAVALVPTGQGVSVFSKTSTGWQLVQGDTAAALQVHSQANTSHTISLAQGEDARGLVGTTVYVGYGLEGNPAESALADMLRNKRFSRVYAFGPSAPLSEWTLQPTDESGLKAYFREALGPAGKRFLSTPWATDSIFMTPVASATTAGSPAEVGALVSGTTVQEQGVDEADLVKTDGLVVLSLSRAAATGSAAGSLQRASFNAMAADSGLTPLDSLALPLSKDIAATGLYLDVAGKQAAVLGEAAARTGIYDAWFAPQWWAGGATEIALIDTSNPTRMQSRRHIRISANLIGSRRIGSTLYLVLRSAAQLPGLDPWWPTEKQSTNQTLLDNLRVADLLPTMTIDGATAQPLFDASACLTQPKNAFNSADIITLLAIDLSASQHRHAARCFTGGTEAFYMSDQSLYLATTRNAYSYSGTSPVYSGQSGTDLHKFALNGLDMTYRGSGNVLGHLGFDQNRKSFRMGEYQGALRVITQTANSWGGWLATPTTGGDPVADSPGHLSILQEGTGGLVLVGELPNARRPAPLGKPGEQLYASRFLGARGFLVTYRLTDPLYVLDLGNPADPFIAGELQVSGYSDYLFPLSDSLLLGVGKDAISDGNTGDGRFAWYQGVKLALIDLTDPTRPREAARSIIGRRGTDATVLHNHHGIALLRTGNTVRLSLPIDLHDTAPLNPTGAANTYFQHTRTELQTFEVTLDAMTLTPRAALPAISKLERDIRNDRAILWNEQVHYYQDGLWSATAW